VGRKTLKTERDKIFPAQGRWWWWLDKKVEERRRQRVKKTITTAGIVAMVLIVLYFTIFRLPPTEQSYLDALTQAERLVGENNIEEALENLQRAMDIFPDRPTPYIMAGCIKEMVGETEEAQRFFTQAKTLYSKEVDFLVERGNWYFRLNLLEKAHSSIMEALQKDPENLAALNLLGSIYEVENKIPEALEVYNRVLELAEKQGVETMIPIIRLKIGMLQLRLPSGALPFFSQEREQ
jgi:tetratricopeptide (TPR) repeat protein